MEHFCKEEWSKLANQGVLKGYSKFLHKKTVLKVKGLLTKCNYLRNQIIVFWVPTPPNLSSFYLSCVGCYIILNITFILLSFFSLQKKKQKTSHSLISYWHKMFLLRSLHLANYRRPFIGLLLFPAILHAQTFHQPIHRGSLEWFWEVGENWRICSLGENRENMLKLGTDSSPGSWSKAWTLELWDRSVTCWATTLPLISVV